MWGCTDVGGNRGSWIIHTPSRTAGVTVHMYTEHTCVHASWHMQINMDRGKKKAILHDESLL